MFRNMVRLILPWILRFLRMMFFLATTSLASIWVGVPQAVTRISENWVGEAVQAGLPVSYHQPLRYAGLVIASITLILGWLILANLTVIIIQLVI